MRGLLCSFLFRGGEEEKKETTKVSPQRADRISREPPEERVWGVNRGRGKMKRTRQTAKKVPAPAKVVPEEEEEEEEEVKAGPEWREVTAEEWFKDAAAEEDGNSSFGDADFGSSDEEPYDSADDEEEEEVYGSDEDDEEERAAREEEADELNGEDEDENEGGEDEDEDDDDVLNPENYQKLVSWLGRHDPPEAEESEDETHNTVGNVPMHWYEDYPHIGYDVDGKKIMKKQGPVKDEMDRFLDRTDDPNYWCTSSPPPLLVCCFLFLFFNFSLLRF
jgi:hypothetical protein